MSVAMYPSGRSTGWSWYLSLDEEFDEFTTAHPGGNVDAMSTGNVA
jgi:hypothetical protein